MNRIYLILPLLFFLKFAHAQTPTLGVGLDALTMNKGTIDVEALTEIIMQKQSELKNEALKRFMMKLFPETNYTTKFYIQNCLHILLNEKNPNVIEKEIYELTTNYALALGVGKVYSLTYDRKGINTAFHNYLDQSLPKAQRMLQDYKEERFARNITTAAADRMKEIDTKISNLIRDIVPAAKYAIERADMEPFRRRMSDSLRNLQFVKLRHLEADRVKEEKKVTKEKFKAELTDPTKSQIGPDTLTLGMWVDIASAALSNTKALTDKGFYRRKIDFRTSPFFLNLKNEGADLVLSTQIKTAINSISRTVEMYVTYHQVIQEFYTAVTAKDGDIKTAIQNQLQATIREIGPAAIEKLAASKTGQDFFRVKESLGKLNITNALISGVEKARLDIQNLPLMYDGIQRKKKLIEEATLKYNDLKTKYAILGSIDTMSLQSDSLLQKEATLNASILSTINGYINSYQQEKSRLEGLKTAFRKSASSIDSLFKVADIPVPSFILTQRSGIAVIDTSQFATTFKAMNDTLTNARNRSTKFLNAIAISSEFLNASLSAFANELMDKYTVTTILNENNKKFYEEYTALLAANYTYVQKLISTKIIGIKDVRYIEEELIPEYIRLSTALGLDTKKVNDFVEKYSILSKMLKVAAVRDLPENFKYNAVLQDVIKFVSNLSELDQAATYQDMLNLFDHANNLLLENLQEGEFKKTYTLFSNAITKYTLINTEKQSVEIDVVSFLVELERYYANNNKSIFGLYLTLGLNQNFFAREVTVPGEVEKIKNIGFASEKLGVKLRFNKIRNLNGLENSVLHDVNLNTNAPFINEWYGIVYGSGLLYSLANTSTNKNFDYPHAGIGTGIRFYNALDFNLVVGLPFIKNQSPFRNAFIGLGLDIPLGEYLEKTGNKK